MWDELSMSDKAKLIKMAVDSGITDLNKVRDVYNEYQQWDLYNKDGVMKDVDYERFNRTLPDNLRDNGDNSGYDMYKYWNYNGKPSDFNEALDREMFSMEDDGFYHAFTIGWNPDTGVGEFMKSKDHPTVWRELDYYNNGRGLREKWGVPLVRDYDTIMNYDEVPLSQEEYDDWKNFKNSYDLVEGDDRYYYVPKNKKS